MRLWIFGKHGHLLWLHFGPLLKPRTPLRKHESISSGPSLRQARALPACATGLLCLQGLYIWHSTPAAGAHMLHTKKSFGCVQNQIQTGRSDNSEGEGKADTSAGSRGVQPRQDIMSERALLWPRYKVRSFRERERIENPSGVPDVASSRCNTDLAKGGEAFQLLQASGVKSHRQQKDRPCKLWQELRIRSIQSLIMNHDESKFIEN